MRADYRKAIAHSKGVNFGWEEGSVFNEPKQAGNPVVVWRDGKMVWLKPEEITW